MSKQFTRKPLSLAVGAALLGAAGMANAGDTVADTDLFTMEELDSAYLIAGAHDQAGDTDTDEGKDGEGSCGEDKGGEGSCGEDKEGEGKCGEGKCGEDS